MKKVLHNHIKIELCNQSAFNAYNAAVSSGQIEKGEPMDTANNDLRISETIRIRDAYVSPEDFNNLSNENKAKILNLKKEFDRLGYIDARTEIGPDQWSRTSKKQSKKIQDKALIAFRMEDELKKLTRKPSKIFSDKKREVTNRIRNEYIKSKSMVNLLKDFKALKSNRMNKTKRQYNEELKKMKASERALKRLEKINYK